MKTALFTLATLFGLGLGLAVVGAEFGLFLLAALLPTLSLVALLWACSDRLLPLRIRAARRIAAFAPSMARLKTHARILTAWRFLPPLLSALMGLTLGAALARDSADLPAALLCGALAAALHLMAFSPTPPKGATPPPPESITDQTQAHLARLITALAPCRDPHLHVAARALRREALALAAELDRAPATQSQAHRALSLWLPALAEAADHLRQHHLTTPDPAPVAELTATLGRVTAQLACLGTQADMRRAEPAASNLGALAPTAL
ncbi:MAG: hypothetical protein C0427_09660 [Rhodobacter sp.]|nr:hypothetical protein [Rhodobacter sp.]